MGLKSWKEKKRWRTKSQKGEECPTQWPTCLPWEGHTFGPKFSGNQWKMTILISYTGHSTYKRKTDQLLRKSILFLALTMKQGFLSREPPNRPKKTRCSVRPCVWNSSPGRSSEQEVAELSLKKQIKHVW